jgi:hypothetical protein
MTTPESSPIVFCVVEFVPGSRVHKERPFVPGLAVVQNGPPGTFVTFVDGRRVPLPTDQIVLTQDKGGVRLRSSGRAAGGAVPDHCWSYRCLRVVAFKPSPATSSAQRWRQPWRKLVATCRGMQ